MSRQKTQQKPEIVRASADAAMLHEIKKNNRSHLDESINDEKDGIHKISLEIA